MQRCALAFVMIALAAGTVAAQPMAGSPTFATLDRQDGESRVGAALGWTFFDTNGTGDFSTLRLDVYGHYVSPGGLGAYGLLPVSFVFTDDDTPLFNDNQSATGNVEGGVLYVIRNGLNDFVLRGGITLPTADDDEGILVNFFGTFPRLTDIALAYPETFWLRLGVSPIFRTGQFVIRLDGGLDFAVSSDTEEPDPIVRLNVGAGIDTGSVAILGELVTVGSPGDNNAESPDPVVFGDEEEDFVHTAAISGRFRLGALEPGVALGFPLDEDIREGIEFFLIASLQGRI
ncbi:MAG TPA: hypothetical protein VIG06_27880 [Kofleriaceae bacterium]|jgi:hypothetical protein